MTLRFEVWVTERVMIPLTEIRNTGREADSGEDEEFEASIVVPSFPESTSKSDLLTSHNGDPALATAKGGYSGLDKVRGKIAIDVPTGAKTAISIQPRQ